jgi:hypothetical protein
MQFPTESGESERHLILLIFTENLKKSNEKDSEDTPGPAVGFSKNQNQRILPVRFVRKRRKQAKRTNN